MPCYELLEAYEVSNDWVYKNNGKKHIAFPNEAKSIPRKHKKQIQLPCGQCIGCRLLYSINCIRI